MGARSRQWWVRTLPILRIPADDDTDVNAILAEDGTPMVTEDGSDMILEES